MLLFELEVSLEKFNETLFSFLLSKVLNATLDIVSTTAEADRRCC